MCKFLVGFWFFWPNHTYALNHYAIGTVAGGALGTSVYILSYVAPRLDFGRMIVRKKNLGFRTISFLNNVRRYRRSATPAVAMPKVDLYLKTEVSVYTCHGNCVPIHCARYVISRSGTALRRLGYRWTLFKNNMEPRREFFWKIIQPQSSLEVT